MKGRQKRIFRIIAQQYNAIAVKRWGAAITPPDAAPTVVDDSQVFAPKQLALQIEAIQAFRAEESYQSLAVGGKRGIGVSRFLVSFRRRLARANGFFPELLSGFLLKAQDHPFLFIIVIGGFDITVIADAQRCFA